MNPDDIKNEWTDYAHDWERSQPNTNPYLREDSLVSGGLYNHTRHGLVVFIRVHPSEMYAEVIDTKGRKRKVRSCYFQKV